MILVMRIAFVGKGGSGKSTLAALFARHISEKHQVLAIDADLNMHLGPLLGFEGEIPSEKHVSNPQATKTIRTRLRGNNQRIKDLLHFRKTTPPAAGSNLIILEDPKDSIITEFCTRNGNINFLVVGTYDADGIGAACYHNDLAILENILSHLVHGQGVVVADMVAGVDAFANTLHAQFDMLVLAVEPTRRGVEVFTQYQNLSREAGVYESLFVAGNKVRSEADKNFLRERIPADKLLGYLGDSEYLRRKDQEGGSLDVGLLESENKKILADIQNKLFSMTPDHQTRLRKLFDLHRRYVAQGFIAERYGDLTDQIDEKFNFSDYAKIIWNKNKPN